MPLAAGAKAPDFRLRNLDGEEQSLEDLLAAGPVLLAFFKISCPVCQFAFPFLERGRENPNIRIVGISQDDAASTRDFAAAFGVRFPILLDEQRLHYPASNGFGITHVPSMFQIEPGGAVSHAWVGFSKADLEAFGKRAGATLFRENEQVPVFRPG